MHLITFSGADDSARPFELAELSRHFGFVEWGILASKTRAGTPRYPTRAWMDDLAQLARGGDLRVAVHINGSWCRALLQGDSAAAREGIGPLLEVARRVQLNLGPVFQVDAEGLLRELEKPPLRNKQIILQVAGAGPAARQLASALLQEGIDVVPLFDASGGGGQTPAEWPRSCWCCLEPALLDHGYAGGLGPHNLEAELPRIAAAAGDAPFWIDLESSLRTIRRGDRDFDTFDVEKVRRVVEISAPLVGRDIAA